MSRSPQVSVVVPARNVSDYLPALLRDLQQQTFTDHEVIVVDDASTDQTPEIIAEFCDADQRFQQLSSHGEGVSVARNVGIEAASGEFLAFADADDRVSPHYLARLHESITATGSDIASCNAERLEDFQTSPSILHRRACAQPVAATHLSRSAQLVWDTTVWNKLWRREMWDRAELRFAEGRWLNDFYPCIRGHLRSRQVDVISDVLYYWRIRTDPTTSITDSRLTDPVARLKSFNDRMFAIDKARAIVAAELKAPRVIHALDLRLLNSDLPIYLPYYTGADPEYQQALVSHIGKLLDDFDIDPRRFPLGMVLQEVYRAIGDRDHERLAVLLSPETEIRSSTTQPHRTELAPARPLGGPSDRPLITRHGPIVRRVRKLAGKVLPGRPAVPSLRVEARVDSVTLDPAQPTRATVRGTARVREGRSDVTGAWSVVAGLEATAGTRRISRLLGGSRRATRLVTELRPPLRVPGPAVPVAAPPDASLHPLVRSGWRPFQADLDLTGILAHPRERQWRLFLELRLGRLAAHPKPGISGSAARYLPVSVMLAETADLIPQSRRGNLNFQVVPAAVRLREAAEAGPEDVRLELVTGAGGPATGPGEVWWQDPDGDRTASTPLAAEVVLPLPAFPADADLQLDLCHGPAERPARLRAHPEFEGVRLPDRGGPGREVVVRATARGNILAESRPRQWELAWLRPSDTAGSVVVGGPGDPEPATRSLTLRCRWTGERTSGPIESTKEGWQATLDLSGFAAVAAVGGRTLSMRVTGGDQDGNSGRDQDRTDDRDRTDDQHSDEGDRLAVTPERRWRFPLTTVLAPAATSVQVRLGEESAPVLWIGEGEDDSRWRQLRKVQRSRQGSGVAGVSRDAGA